MRVRPSSLRPHATRRPALTSVALAARGSTPSSSGPPPSGRLALARSPGRHPLSYSRGVRRSLCVCVCAIQVRVVRVLPRDSSLAHAMPEGGQLYHMGMQRLTGAEKAALPAGLPHQVKWGASVSCALALASSRSCQPSAHLLPHRFDEIQRQVKVCLLRRDWKMGYSRLLATTVPLSIAEAAWEAIAPLSVKHAPAAHAPSRAYLLAHSTLLA